MDYSTNIGLMTPPVGDPPGIYPWSDNVAIFEKIAFALSSRNRVVSGCATTLSGGLGGNTAPGVIFIGGELVTIPLTIGGTIAGVPSATDHNPLKLNWLWLDDAGVRSHSDVLPSGEFVLLAISIGDPDLGIVNFCDISRIMVEITNVARTEGMDFDYTDIYGSGTVTYTHNLGLTEKPVVTVWDDSGVMRIPDSVTEVDSNTISVDITSHMPAYNTWHISLTR